MTPELEKALKALRAAIDNEGPHVAYHRAAVRETEKNWPTLMEAVRKVLEVSRIDGSA
jgi:hypothetical protein